jgi:hypothetical protein
VREPDDRRIRYVRQSCHHAQTLLGGHVMILVNLLYIFFAQLIAFIFGLLGGTA